MAKSYSYYRNLLISLRSDFSVRHHPRGQMRKTLAVAVATIIWVLIFALHPGYLLAQSAPHVDSVTPTSAAVGGTVTIAGTNFGSTPNRVQLGSYVGSIVSWTDQQVVATVHDASYTGTAAILNSSAVWSNSVPFTVLRPVITGVSPSSGAAGTSVTITGTGFGSTQAGGTVKFGGYYGTAVTPTTWSDTSITANAPPAVTTSFIEVNSYGTSSNDVQFRAPTGNFTPTTGSLTNARWAHAATLLNDGRVLITGGVDTYGEPVAGAEIYNPSTGTFTSYTSAAAGYSTATLLGNGKVLIAGGIDSTMTPIATAWLFDPQNNTFSPTGGLNHARRAATATLLANGNVLIAGGSDSSGPLASAELYDPALNSFTPTGALTNARHWATATLLASGKVLVAGGYGTTPYGSTGASTTSAELYDPASATFSNVGSMQERRAEYTATLLNNGKVLMAGGIYTGQGYLSSVELFDPAANTFSFIGNHYVPSLTTIRHSHAATLLSSGKVLLLGGYDGVWNPQSTAELYDPSAQSFTYDGSMNEMRVDPAIVGLANGQVLVVGGYAGYYELGALSDAELYQPGTQATSSTVLTAIPNPASYGSPVTLTATIAPGGCAGAVTFYNYPYPIGTANLSGGHATLTLSNPGAVGSQGFTAWYHGNVDCQSSTSSLVLVTVNPATSSTSVSSSSNPSIQGNSVIFTATVTPSLCAGTVTFKDGANSIGTGTVGGGTATLSIANLTAGSHSITAAYGGNGVCLSSTSAPLTQTVTGVPTISSATPASGPVGTLVTITGARFGASQGSGFVLLGTSHGRVVGWSDTQVTAIVAPDSTSGTVQITQLGLASNSLNFTIATPAITSVSPTSGAVGTQVTIGGSGFGATPANVTLGTRYGVVVSWSDTAIVANVAPGSMSGIAQVIVSGGASNSPSFTVVPPAITTVSPASGSAGTQVTIVGSGFGAAQGSGQVLLGTAYGAVVSWSDTQVVATIPLGSSSGVAQVWQGGIGSNTQTFTVTTPTVASVSPTSAGAGVQVTIAGSGFGAAQGSGAAWLGTGYATVVTWTDTQIVATVAQGSASGVAQVLQNGVWSNSVPFATLTPQITSINPTSGAANTAVTITGSGFGASQGSGTVMVGSAAGVVSTWTDTQVVAAVASAALTGSVRIQQNGIWSNAVRFVVPTNQSGGNDVTLTPSLVSMLSGETRTLQALNSSGAPVTGLTWASSDVTVASLSTDDPPIITALSAGHTTITAGDASADVTVYSGSALPTGTVIWSAPGDGSYVTKILPAVPSPTGVADVFAVQSSGNVQAITADGRVAWTANPESGDRLPDFQGGLVVSGNSVTRLDGMTGQATPLYTYSQFQYTNVAVHTDGTIFTFDGSTLVGIDPATGPKFSIPLEDSSDTWTDGCGGQSGQDGGPAWIDSNLVIAGDGYAYALYAYYESSVTYEMGAVGCDTTGLYTIHYRLVRVSTDGTAQKIVIGDWPVAQTSTVIRQQWPASVRFTISGTIPGSPYLYTLVTNADAGVTLALNYPLGAYCPDSTDLQGCNTGVVPARNVRRLLTISGGNIASDNSLNLGNSMFTPVLQAQDGTYFGTLRANSYTPPTSMNAVDLSGNVKWIVPGGFAPVMATADGGLVAKSSGGQYVTFDQNGVANGMLATFPTYSWVGDAYQLGSVDQTAALPPHYAPSFLAMVGASNSQNGTAVKQTPFPPLPSCNDPTLKPPIPCPGPAEIVRSALAALRSLVQHPCLNCAAFVFQPIGSIDDQAWFSKWLNGRVGLFDGTNSNFPLSQMCSVQSWDGLWCALRETNSKAIVADYFDYIRNPQYTGATNITQMPSTNGLLTYYDPFWLCKNGTQSNGLYNEAVLFHEALHGYYGMSDATIQEKLGLSSGDSVNITFYINHNVFGGSQSICGR